MPHTNGSVYLWNGLVSGNSQNYALQVFSPNHIGDTLARLRLLARNGDAADAGSVPLFDPRLEPGSCSVVLYDKEFPFDMSLSIFLKKARRNQVILLSQQATRTVFPLTETLPDHFGNTASVAKTIGATCIIFDHPVAADDVSRLLTALNPPPAILVFAPAPEESKVLSPDIEQILALPVTRRFDTSGGAAIKNTGAAQ
jgi:hypothetical protein